MREPLNQAFYKTLATYRNLKECKSKHFFDNDIEDYKILTIILINWHKI